MRNFGLRGKQFSLCRRRRAKTYVLPFDIKSHGSGVHPDLNMSEFSRLGGDEAGDTQGDEEGDQQGQAGNYRRDPIGACPQIDLKHVPSKTAE